MTNRIISIAVTLQIAFLGAYLWINWYSGGLERQMRSADAVAFMDQNGKHVCTITGERLRTLMAHLVILKSKHIAGKTFPDSPEDIVVSFYADYPDRFWLGSRTDVYWAEVHPDFTSGIKSILAEVTQ